MMREVLKQPDVGKGQVTRKQGHHLHVDSVRGLRDHRHGDDSGTFPTHRPVATIVDH